MDLSYLVSPRGGDVHPACAVRGVHSPVNTHRPLGHDGVIPEYRPLIGPSTRLIGHWPGAVLEGPHVPHHSRGTLYDVRNSPGVSELPWQSPPEIVHIQPHVIINLDNEPRSSTIPCHGQHGQQTSASPTILQCQALKNSIDWSLICRLCVL